MRNAFGLMIVLLVTGNTAGLAQHWPHWRGPTHDGVSAEKGLPDTWSATCAATPVGADEGPGGPLGTDAVAEAQRPQRPGGGGGNCNLPFISCSIHRRRYVGKAWP